MAPFLQRRQVVVQASAPALQPAAMLRRLGCLLRVWTDRIQQRRALASLSERCLKDMGISRYDALHEARKPFWRD